MDIDLLSQMIRNAYPRMMQMFGNQEKSLPTQVAQQPTMTDALSQMNPQIGPLTQDDYVTQKQLYGKGDELTSGFTPIPPVYKMQNGSLIHNDELSKRFSASAEK